MPENGIERAAAQEALRLLEQVRFDDHRTSILLAAAIDTLKDSLENDSSTNH